MELLAPRALAAITWEMFGSLLWLAMAVVLAALALAALARRRGARWRVAARIAGGFGALVALGILAALPGFTHASLGDLSGALDWLTWAVVGVGAGVAAALVAMPVLALALRERTHGSGEAVQRGAASSLR